MVTRSEKMMDVLESAAISIAARSITRRIVRDKISFDQAARLEREELLNRIREEGLDAATTAIAVDYFERGVEEALQVYLYAVEMVDASRAKATTES